MNRIVVTSLVVVALAAGGVTMALAQSGSASAPVTKARANAFAQAVNVRASDLPGATAIQGAIFGEEAVQYEALRCGRHGAGYRPVGGGESWLGDSQPQANVGSIVLVAPSQHAAAIALDTLGTRRGRACLARALGRALTFERHHQPERSHTVKVTFVPASELGGGGTVAVHVLAKLPPIEEENPPPKPKARYIHVDAAIFRVGPAEVAFFALAANQFPLATEAHLLALLRTRAETHKL